jgi:hypothetical protein
LKIFSHGINGGYQTTIDQMIEIFLTAIENLGDDQFLSIVWFGNIIFRLMMKKFNHLVE